jgi:cellulose synthase/poly-beta-1,6-N-acetylglucosamine synthase-like glycosyltransferase
MTEISVVIPTLGRPSLGRLLAALAPQVAGDAGVELILVDDRPGTRAPLEASGACVLRGAAAGPAAARNVGWRHARGRWVAFLDDDVVPAPDWLRDLRRDLAVGQGVGGVQGRVSVPLPGRPTDWERCTARLADSAWITADLAYRRAALAAVGGFDERFPRAYREDAELAYRVRRAGWELVVGERRCSHPVRPAGRWASLRAQRGNADDALLRRLYGPRWHDLLAAPAGRRRRHAVVTASGALALAATVAGASSTAHEQAWRKAVGVAAGLGAAGWLLGTAEFAVHRLRSAAGERAHPLPVLATSVAIPPLAVAHWLAGWLRHRAARPIAGPSGSVASSAGKLGEALPGEVFTSPVLG